MKLAVVVLVVDLVNGMIAPTFPLYALHRGASLAFVGILAATAGFARLAGALPSGAVADHFGRRVVIAVGAILFATACLLFAASTTPEALILPRVLFGLGGVATFPIGVAYIADRASGRARDIGISWYVAAQGAGYALGPSLGGLLAQQFGYQPTFVAAGCLSGGAGLFAWLALENASSRVSSPAVSISTIQHHRPGRPPLRSLFQHPALAKAGSANSAVMFMNSAAVLPFLAVEGARLGLGHIFVGLLYSARASMSTLARVPTGIATKWLAPATLMTMAVAVDVLAALLLGLARGPTLLLGAALLDGCAFGAFLASSQAYVAEHSNPGSVARTLGAYTMAGSVGESVGGLLTGLIAHQLGVTYVFRVAALVLFATTLSLIWPLSRNVFLRIFKPHFVARRSSGDIERRDSDLN